MAACQALLDPLGSLEQPVHSRVERIGTDALDVQFLRQGRLPQSSAGEELGARLDNALSNHRQDQVTLFAGFAIEQLGQFQAFDHGQNRFHVPMRQRPLDFELVLGLDVLLASEAASNQLDAIGGKMREVRDGSFLDFAVFSVRLHEEIGDVFAVLALAPRRYYVDGTMWERYRLHGWSIVDLWCSRQAYLLTTLSGSYGPSAPLYAGLLRAHAHRQKARGIRDCRERASGARGPRHRVCR